MALFIGVDGGGTKTKVALINEKETVLFIGEAGPSSIDTVPIADTLRAITMALHPYVSTHPALAIEGLFAGLGGIVLPSQMNQVEQQLRTLTWVSKTTRIRVRNDMENALYSGLLFKEGMALIVGTGMVAFGKDSHGNTHKSGGWGYKEGDAGSAYDLGFQALHYVIRAFDGRYPKDDFALAIAAQIGMKEPHDIVSIMDQWYDQRTKIAQLAPLVTTFANRNNAGAQAICQQAVKELQNCVRAVYHSLNHAPKRLVVVGSLGNAPGYFKEQLALAIQQIDAAISITQPLIDPAVAAALMALRL